jgi:hypothetical protein
MKDQKQSLKDTLRHIGLRTVAAALCIFLITVTMTAYIGNRFYRKLPDLRRIARRAETVSAAHSLSEMNRGVVSDKRYLKRMCL